MSTVIYAQNTSAESVNKHLNYFQSHVNIPDGYILASVKDVKVDKKEAYCFRYIKDVNNVLGGEHFSFIVTKDSPYVILGFTTMDSKYIDKEQLNKEEVQKISTEFLSKIDDSLLNDLELQWIDSHDEEIVIDGVKKIVRGLKCKYYRPSQEDYAWVIVGYDGTIITFERDILWSEGMQKRITEKWLHDSWLKEN